MFATDKAIRVYVTDAAPVRDKVTTNEPTPAAPRSEAAAEATVEKAAGEPTPAEPTPASPAAATPASPLPVPEETRRSTVASPTPAKRPFRVEAVTPAVEVLGGANEDTPPASTEPTAPVEVVQQRYPNGKLMLEREVTQDAEGNYVQHGAWKLWDQEGNLVADGSCRDNQLHGLWRRIYQGKESKLFLEAPYGDFELPFLSEATFEDGMLHGRWVIRDARDRKISELEFADGDRHGTATWWYVNGKKMQQIPFRNGFVDGMLRHWSPEGELLNEENYIGGRKQEAEVTTYANGQPKSEVSYLQPQLVIQSPDDWWNAKLAVFGLQGQREKHGPEITWHTNGQKASEIEYEHGQMNGACRWWYVNGQLKAEGEHLKGQLSGNWKWWHANGQKSAIGEYASGAPTGAWQWWQEDGRLKSKIAAGQQLFPQAPEADDSQQSATARSPNDLRRR